MQWHQMAPWVPGGRAAIPTVLLVQESQGVIALSFACVEIPEHFNFLCLFFFVCFLYLKDPTEHKRP